MFGLFSVPWDFFHIGLLIVVIMIMITGMVICVSVVGVCCYHWLDGVHSDTSEDNDNCEYDENSNAACQYNHQNQSVHVVVVDEKKGEVTLDPCQLRDHLQRLEVELSHRRLAYEERHVNPDIPQLHISPCALRDKEDSPPPSYEMLYPPSASQSTTSVASPETK